MSNMHSNRTPHRATNRKVLRKLALLERFAVKYKKEFVFDAKGNLSAISKEFLKKYEHEAKSIGIKVSTSYLVPQFEFFDGNRKFSTR